MTTHTADTVLFSCTDVSEQCIQSARDYIDRMKLTAEDAKIVRRDGMVMVVLKKDVTL